MVSTNQILARLLSRRKKVAPRPTRSANQTVDSIMLSGISTPRDDGKLSPHFQRPGLPKDLEELSSTAREKWIVRNTPVVGAKYVAVWKRLRSKLKTKLMLDRLRREIQLFGTNLYKGAQADKALEQQMEALIRRKESRSILPEKEDSEKLPWTLLHPTSFFRSLWNAVVIVLLVYTATMMPFRMAFDRQEEEPFSWQVFEWILNGLFFIDVIVTCVSSYYDDEGKLVVSHKKILLSYASTWMLMDIAGCVPFDLFFAQDSSKQANYNNLIRLSRLPRLYRLTRLARLLKMCKLDRGSELMEQVQDFLGIKNTALRLISFFFTVLVCVHLMSCMWFFVAKIEDFGPNTWVVQVNLQDKSIASQYISSFYWAFTTLATVGYGDISGNTSAERIVAVMWMMFGVYFFSFTIGSLSSIVSSIDTKDTILTTKLAIVDEFVREAHLDRGMRNRLRTAIKYNSEKEGYSLTDKQDIFYDLPKSLRYEVALAMHQGVVRTLPFFTEKHPVFVSSIVPFLKPVFVKAATAVYQEKDHADEAYFIVKGGCGVVYGSENFLVKKLPQGSYFGEIEVIQGVPRLYAVMAVVDTDLLVMRKKLIATIQQDFPGIYQEMVDVADMRNRLNHKAIAEHRELLKLKKEQHLETMGLGDIKASIQQRAEQKLQKQLTLQSPSPQLGWPYGAKEPEVLKQVLESEGRLRDLEKEMKGIFKLVAEQTEIIASLKKRKVRRGRPASLDPTKD